MSALAHTGPLGCAAEPPPAESRAEQGESLLTRDEIDAVLGRVERAPRGGGKSVGAWPELGRNGAPEPRNGASRAKEEILGRFAHLLESSLRRHGLDPVAVRLACADVRTRNDLAMCEGRAASALFHIPGLDARGVARVDAHLADALVRRLFAKTRTRSGRTLVERVLVQRVLDIAVGDLRRAFQPWIAGGFIMERVEAEGRSATSEAGLDAFTARFWVGLEKDGGVLDLTLPAVLLGRTRGSASDERF